MTGEEYYNLKQGDKVIVTKSTPKFLGMKGTIYEMVYRDHYKEAIYLKCIQTVDNKYLELGCVKIVDPATALQYIDIYNDSMKKKELKIQVDFNVGDEFWIMINNKPKVKKVKGINIEVIGNDVHILYESDISVYNPSSIYHTKQELLDSL